MRRVVFDANVWVSALAFAGPIPRRAIDLSRHEEIQSVIAQPIIEEVLRALTGFRWSPDEVKRAEVEIRELSEIVRPTIRLAVVTTKPSDNRVLECAVAGSVDWIVTGDRKHLLPLGQYDGIPILSPRDFLTAFQQRQV